MPTHVSLDSPHAIIILVLSLFSFSLISIFLYTTHRYPRIPRHPVISALLYTTLPRILILLSPFFIEDSLRQNLPFDAKLRTDHQQSSPLAKFCLVQGLLANYLLAVHAAFITSFSIALLHVLAHPQSHLRPSPAPSHSAHTQHVPRPRSRLTIFLVVFPLLCVLPIPLLRLFLILFPPKHTTIQSHHPIYYQGSYCNIDFYAFQFVSGILSGLPLIVALGILFYIGIRSAIFYLKPSSRRLALNPPSRTMIIRLGTLVALIAISTVMFLLQVSLANEQLFRVLEIDRYWEALVPLLEFLIFGTQATTLEIWFPKLFAPEISSPSGSRSLFRRRRRTDRPREKDLDRVVTIGLRRELGVIPDQEECRERYTKRLSIPPRVLELNRISSLLRVGFGFGVAETSQSSEEAILDSRTSIHADPISSSPNTSLRISVDGRPETPTSPRQPAIPSFLRSYNLPPVPVPIRSSSGATSSSRKISLPRWSTSSGGARMTRSISNELLPSSLSANHEVHRHPPSELVLAPGMRMAISDGRLRLMSENGSGRSHTTTTRPKRANSAAL